MNKDNMKLFNEYLQRKNSDENYFDNNLKSNTKDKNSLFENSFFNELIKHLKEKINENKNNYHNLYNSNNEDLYFMNINELNHEIPDAKNEINSNNFSLIKDSD